MLIASRNMVTAGTPLTLTLVEAAIALLTCVRPPMQAARATSAANGTQVSHQRTAASSAI
eukprot:563782-Rhodomonas_salina.1